MIVFTNGQLTEQQFISLYGKRTLTQTKRYASIYDNFTKQFGHKTCHFASSPGRVEIVGNHTDHNGGQVVGSAIDLDIVAAFLPTDGNVRMRSEHRKDINIELDDTLSHKEHTSKGLVKGVLYYLQQKGYKVGGFDAYLHSNVPSGIGISSSAAFELLVGQIVNHCYNDGQIPLVELARAGQYAENHYYNKPSGLLDQGVVAVGGLVHIDFEKGFDATQIESKITNLCYMLIDTGKTHSSLNNLYATIPTDMKKVANLFGKQRLVEVDELQFEEQQNQVICQCGELPYFRAKHFFEENKRVVKAVEAINQGDTTALLALLTQSGLSSKHQLQNVAVDSSDTAISDCMALATSINNTVGVRVHGGGFAGTVLCVVEQQHKDKFVEQMKNHYGENHVLVMKKRSIGATVL